MPDSRTTVLVVDDDEHLLATITDFLRFEGFEVMKASGGTQAMALLRTVHPDVILLDVMMPGMDGGEVAQAVRAIPGMEQTPIIFTTAVISKSEARTHDGQIGGEMFLAKPFKLEELTATIQSALAHRH
ncbi:MAG: response regulator [Verrucomicrobia bacterium]|nr:response regulator [Verrucomicrobiota bacterium]